MIITRINIPQNKINYFRKKIIKWGQNNLSSFPWRETENKWHALVAEIMLQRTNAEQVVSVYKSFCSKYKKPGDLLKDKDTEIFKNLGLLWRENQIKKLADILSDREIPEDKDSLLKLPAVGDYIASAYRSLHLGLRDVIIDSNIVRILGRYYGFKTDSETRRKNWLFDLADRITPVRNYKKFNYGIIDFTRLICRPKALCKICILSKKCNCIINKI